MKFIIQIAEVSVGLTVALFLGWKIYTLVDSSNFSWYWRQLGVYFSQLFWFSFYSIFFGILSAVLIVMAGRWVMSWASNNGWQTPNNKWN